ncbi:MAG: inositol monophosphatase [Bacteroidales bacterium]|nr:inositol monophosphatase [Bacteroidales bacterium]
MNMDYHDICMKVCEISRMTGKYITSQSEKFIPEDVMQKGIHDYVSYVDKTAEQMIVEELKSLLPEAGFITEEETAGYDEQIFRWIIDPLDGTTNFIHKVPLFSVSIALMEQGEVVVGVVYEINRDECFYAWKGGIAMLNGKEIHVSPSQDFNSSLLATGFPYYDYGRLDAYLAIFKHFMQHTAGIRRLGSAAADLAYVACGRFEGFYEYGLHAWDVAAGAFIVQMAGGKVTDFKGNNNYIFGAELIAGNKPAHQEMIKVIDQKFNAQSH